MKYILLLILLGCASVEYTTLQDTKEDDVGIIEDLQNADKESWKKLLRKL